MLTNLPTKINLFSAATTGTTYVTENVNDALVGVFESRSSSKESARALTSAVLSAAHLQKLNIMSLIDDLSTLNNNELNGYIALMLNTSRAGTSLLGINNQPITPFNVSRGVLA